MLNPDNLMLLGFLIVLAILAAHLAKQLARNTGLPPIAVSGAVALAAHAVSR